MTKDEIVSAIKDIIHTIAPDEDLTNLVGDERLRDQIELDSMDFLDIVMELRKRYGVQVPEEDYKELASLDGCSAYLHPLMESKELKLTTV
jgi:acyl carrier protein